MPVCFPALPNRRDFHRRLIALLAIFACALAIPTANAAGQDWAEKMFQSTSHDFRTVGRGTKCEYHFEFKNLYQEDVHVSAVRSSCGCTTPTVTQRTLKTHETSAVVATFNTSTFVGQKSAVLTVVFDKPSYAEVQLKVNGFIRTDITFDPPEVAFGEIESGAKTSEEIVITHTGNSRWQITDVRSHCEHLQVQLSPAKRTAAMVQYRMRVNVLDTMPEGDVRERLTLISNDAQFPTTEMSINGRIRPSLSISPAAVSLGTAQRDVTVEKRLLIRGDEPFQVTDVVCADPRFEFVTPPGSKKLHFVTLRFTAGQDGDRVGQEVKIKTDFKGGRDVSCVVTGIISD